MKRFLNMGWSTFWATVLTLASHVCSVRAQSPASPKLQICGYQFVIGMNMEVAFSNVDKGLCKVVRLGGTQLPDDSAYLINSKTGPFSSYGSLEFKGKKLTKVSKSWGLGVTSAQKYSDVLVGLLLRFQEELNNTSCSISGQRKEEPQVSLKQVSIYCGRRRIELTSFESDGSKQIQIDEIVE